MPTTPPSLEDDGRYSAGELVDLITMHAKSAADVPTVIEQLIAFMRDEWSNVNWDEQEYGLDGPEMKKWTRSVEDDYSPDDELPPFLKLPPDRLKRLLGEDEEDGSDE